MGLERFTNLTTLNIDWDIGDYTVSSVSGYFTEKTTEMRETITDELLAFAEWEDESFSPGAAADLASGSAVALDGWRLLSRPSPTSRAAASSPSPARATGTRMVTA